MSERFRILCIDDEPVLHTVLEATLGFDYEVDLALDGQCGLDAALLHRPDVILLDITMPGLSGYEVCRRLRAEESTRDVPVIFLSALDHVEDRLAAYDAGGDDFIGKPFEQAELAEKIEVTLRRVANFRLLQAEKSAAQATAMTALSMTGEMGVVLAFLQRSFNCGDYVSLADAVLEAAAEWGLVAKVQVRGADGKVSRNRAGDSTPLEAGVLSSVAAYGRMATLGCRQAVSFERVTLLIENMPLADAERCGRLRDALAWLGGAADARARAIDTGPAMTSQRQTLHRLVNRTRAALAAIRQRETRKKDQAATIMEGMLLAIEGSFFQLGLSEAQEARVAETLRRAVNQVIALFEEELGMDRELSAIAAELEAPVTASPEAV